MTFFAGVFNSKFSMVNSLKSSCYKMEISQKHITKYEHNEKRSLAIATLCHLHMFYCEHNFTQTSQHIMVNLV